MKNGNCIENANFSSKKTAIASLDYIADSWSVKMDITEWDFEQFGCTSKLTFIDDYSLIIGKRFKLSLTKREVYKTVTKYVEYK